MRFGSIWYNKYTLLIMARLKQAYYGSCFLHLVCIYNWKSWPIHFKKGPSNFSDMGPWAHTLLFLGNTLYRRLKDNLRYPHTRCSRASGLLASISQHVYHVRRKVELSRNCPLFSASFGKLWLSDQVQFIGWHGIQRRSIWIFCRESEVSG